MIRDQKQATILNLDSGALFNPPRVLIELEPAIKIRCLTHLAPGEIDGFGWVERQGNEFLVTDTFILKQKASDASAEPDPLALNKLVGECEDPSKLTFHWHSHGSGGVFFSIEPDIRTTIGGWLGDFLVSLVVNKRGEYRCRIDIFKPLYLTIGVPLWVIVPVEDGLISHCKKEIELKVEEVGAVVRVVRKVLEKDQRLDDSAQQKKLVAIVPFEDLILGEGES